MPARIRSDDEVLVIGGKDRGKRGKVLRVEPKKDRVFVEGLNMIKRHQRPQQTVNADAHAFATRFGATHDIQFGGSFRTTDAWTLNQWPGNGVLALENSPTDLRAQVFRQGYGGNRANYFATCAVSTS